MFDVVLKYLWASFPRNPNMEYKIHKDRSTSGQSVAFDAWNKPYPLVDDYFVFLSAMSLMELTPVAQKMWIT